MESRNIKVIDEHGIDRNASVICSIDVDGSDYVIYRIERDSDNDNLFVSKLVKNNDGTSNMINVDDSLEKSNLSEIVKELVMHSINDDNDAMSSSVVTLKNGKSIKVGNVLFNKEQNINVQKTYVTTVKKSVTSVSEKYYHVDVVPTNENVTIENQETANSNNQANTETVPSEVVMPNIEAPVEKVVEPVVAPLEPALVAPALQAASEVPKVSPAVEPVAPAVPSAPAPVETPVSAPVVEVKPEEPKVSPVVEPIAPAVPSAPAPVETPVSAPAVEVKPEEPKVSPVASSVAPAPVVEPVVAPVQNAQVTPVAPVAPAPAPVVAPAPQAQPTVSPSEPTKGASNESVLFFDGSKETNLANTSTEKVGQPAIAVDAVQPIREFGQDVPIVNDVKPAEVNGNANSESQGFANNKFFMVIAIVFFLASCVFLGYEAFKFFQMK